MSSGATGGSHCYLTSSTEVSTEFETHHFAMHRVERITKIQATFGVSIQMLAEILRVSRPQLYKWLDANRAIELQGGSRDRMGIIEELAEYWRSLTQRPLGPWVKEGRAAASLLALLCADPLDNEEIRRAMTTQAELISRAAKSRSERFREAGFQRRPSVRSLPSDE